jgi:Kazal-type serine protease inhibitor domain
MNYETPATVSRLVGSRAIGTARLYRGVSCDRGAAMAAEPNNDNFRQRRPSVCTQQYAPVCGEMNGVTKTYSNACFAAADGAKVIAQGPCR